MVDLWMASGLTRYSQVTNLLEYETWTDRLLARAFLVEATGTATVNLEPVDVVTVTIEPPRRRGERPDPRGAGNPDNEKIVLYIGQTDHLIRRCVRDAPQGDGRVLFTETWSHVRANEKVTEAPLSYHPPKGAKDYTVPPAPPTYVPPPFAGGTPGAI